MATQSASNDRAPYNSFCIGSHGYGCNWVMATLTQPGVRYLDNDREPPFNSEKWDEFMGGGRVKLRL